MISIYPQTSAVIGKLSVLLGAYMTYRHILGKKVAYKI
jgi:hypothetical protein